MSCNQSETSTLGGSQFNALIGSGIKDRGSTNATGRHGASNFWGKWPQTGSKKGGISARAPYDLGNVKTPNTLAGSTLHHTGLDLGAHGHGIGVVPAAIGGAHNKRTLVATISAKRTDSGGFEIETSASFCWKCFGTWVLIGVVVLFVALFSGK